ncbi:MAG: hypothetical protein H0V17_19605 [Deltaproteobacteria bacterium]|nr:hypothetical protein [Deltaproteobacteria bacterium]
MRIGIAVIAAGAMASSPAHADGAFFEGDVGLAVPIADDDYEASVDDSLKLGLRLGTRTGFGGLDLGIDVTPYSDDLDSGFADIDIERYRFQIGARYEKPVGAKARLFFRAAGGIDLLHYTAEGSILGVAFETSETDVGIALEVAGGVLFDVGKVQLGVKLGLPFAFHFDDDDPNDPEDADLEYTGVDLDLAFVVGVSF